MHPRFSIVIPFYSGFPYIEQCVESVLSQDFSDIEVLIVDDRDPAHSGDALDDLYKSEARVKVIHRNENGGTLRARKEGVLASSGEYVMFMDQDDALVSGALAAVNAELASNPVDILHFGVNVIAESEAAKGAQRGMAGYLTAPVRELHGEEILRFQFALEDGFDWQVHHKAYSAEVARKAWSLVQADGLSYSDDLYANFITCLVASSYRAISDVLYEYHLGRGETLGNAYSFDNFERWCHADAMAFESVKAFIAEHEADFPRPDYPERLADVRDLLVSHSINEAFDNLPSEDCLAAVERALTLWAADAVAGELWRFVRDRVYSLLHSSDPARGLVDLSDLVDLAKRVDAKVEDGGSSRYRSMRDAAIGHVNDLERKLATFSDAPHTLIAQPRYEAQSVRIFVTTHKDVNTYHSDILQPVQVGPVKNRKRLMWAYQDDSGENIAEQNPMYCELTTQYWAWKNVEAEYYGFCHYRRYFDFSEEEHEENPWGEVMDNTIDWGTQERYCLDDASITAAVDGFDIVTTGIKDLANFPEKFASTHDHYARAPHLRIQHLDRIIEILKEEHPDYAEDADAFIVGSKSCFCNMYIMRKELFFRYCEWMFPMLERFVSEWDTSLLSHEGLRTPGHLSERLFNIWLNHEKRTNAELKHKEVQCVHFEHPEHHVLSVLRPIENADKPIIPVIFAADNNYVPMLTTAISSMLENASKDYFYDVVVIEDGISGENKRIMQDFLHTYANATLRFFGAGALIGGYELTTSNEHISKETYYRFLIQDILPYYSKVLYLDSDLIIEGDVAELYSTELGSNLLAAAHDVDYMGNLNMPDGQRMEYTKEVLEMDDPYSYFQAGVLVFNTAEMRKLHTVGEWMEIASNPNYIYNDQDILNANCEGRVTYLDYSWNVMHDCGGRVANVFSFAPAAAFDAYSASRANPKIIHYAGFEKPWTMPECDYSERYWAYARKTPFYEKLLSFISKHRVKELCQELQHRIDNLQWQIDILNQPAKAIGENNPLRKVVDPIMPMGSKRREVAKSVGRRLRGRS